MAKKVPLKVQKRSGFNKSFQNILTSKPGTITPLLCDELIPNTKVNLRAAMQASLPPLAFDTFMRVSLKVQAFFVPLRLLAGSFQDFFTSTKYHGVAGDYTPTLPYFRVDFSDLGPNWESSFPAAAGSLADYLGIKVSPSGFQGAGFRDVSAMPFLAYHRVYDDWFRNTRIQKPLFVRDDSDPAVSSPLLRCAPFNYYNVENGNDVLSIGSTSSPLDAQFILNDGVSIFSLRQANFEDDYFTIAMQQESEQDIKITIDNGEFSIGALRGGNALQIYADRHALCGPRYIDRLATDYGAHLSDGVAQRTIPLGSMELEVFSKGIYSNSPSSAGAQVNNPFESVGARYGDAYATGGDKLADFTAEESGYLMVLCELVPRVTYGSGIDRKFNRYIGPGSITDMANPILQGVGNQPIFMDEINSRNSHLGIFGFTERYADWKTKCDEVHALVKETENLGAMVLQRNFDSSNQLMINSNFIEIPTDYMDNVTAVTAEISNYGYWLDCFFDYKVSMPLASYSIPTLEDVSNEHQDTIYVRPGGRRMP